jgi:SAM-dependent methyltransferase
VSGATGPESPGTASAVRAEGRLSATLRTVLSYLLRPVLRPLRRELDEQRERGGALHDTSVRLERQLDELHRHADTRLDQAGGEIADLRGAFLTTRTEIEQERGRATTVAERLQAELEALRDRRVPSAESDLAKLQAGLTALQGEVEGVRDRRLVRLEDELGRHHGALAAVQSLAEELRDQRLPALSGRLDALIERLHEEIVATASLAERLAAGEGLKVTAPAGVEARIPEAVARASVRFADAFRGAREEILGRIAEYIPLLEGHGPVLDLGCGRGELLEALRTAGIESRGVDNDPAMVEACRRLGVPASESEAIEALRASAPASLGAVTAIHVVEHLAAAAWMELIGEAARALRPGGVLLVESPNPDSLRVGAGLFWTDPTHRAPVHPEALAFVVRAVGLEVAEVRLLRPFPAEQELAREDQPGPVRELAKRLDRWLSGPRDYLLVARKAVSS